MCTLHDIRSCLFKIPLYSVTPCSRILCCPSMGMQVHLLRVILNGVPHGSAVGPVHEQACVAPVKKGCTRNDLPLRCCTYLSLHIDPGTTVPEVARYAAKYKRYSAKKNNQNRW